MYFKIKEHTQFKYYKFTGNNEEQLLKVALLFYMNLKYMNEIYYINIKRDLKIKNPQKTEDKN